MKRNRKLLFFYVYPSAFQNPGGGEILLLKTKEHLEKLGTSVRLFDLWNDRLKEGDVLHVFGSVKEALGLMETAKTKGVKIVHSPIIWYNWQSSFRIAYALKERWLCVLRQAAKTFFPALPSERRRMMQVADVVLAGSEMEAWQIQKYFLISREKIRVVPYGADAHFQEADGNLFTKKHGIENFILSVGRIEPRKNQLNLIRAVKDENIPLVIIGSPVSHHMEYYRQCRNEASSNIKFVDFLDRDSAELRSAFAACDVFVLPSWFETPGLAALEAGLAGAKIVITRGGSTREYFRDLVIYADPGKPEDIKKQIQTALQQKKTSVLKNHIARNYLWENTAKQTLSVYHSLVEHLN